MVSWTSESEPPFTLQVSQCLLPSLPHIPNWIEMILSRRNGLHRGSPIEVLPNRKTLKIQKSDSKTPFFLSCPSPLFPFQVSQKAFSPLYPLTTWLVKVVLWPCTICSAVGLVQNHNISFLEEGGKEGIPAFCTHATSLSASSHVTVTWKNHVHHGASYCQ